MKQSEKYSFPIFEDEDNVELDKYTEELTEKLEDLEDTDREEINNIYKDVQASKIHYETEQAKSLYIDDATDSRGKIEVFGNVEQETSTASANLLDTYLFEEKTVNGITLTKKENGAIVLNGTATAQTLFEAKLKQSINKNMSIFKIAKVSGTVSTGNVQFFLYTDGYTANKNIAVTTNVNSANTTLDNNTYTIERIVIPNGTVLSNVEINTMVSETDTSYVSFTPDTPSINYPSKIIALGSNKNELHMQEKEYTAVGINVTQKESSLQLNGTTTSAANLLSGNFVDIGRFKKGKHILSITEKGSFERSGSSDFSFSIKEKNNTSNVCANITGANLQGGKSSFAFELDEEKDLVIQMFANASNIVFDNFEMLLKIEEGETATSYSPYRTRQHRNNRYK